MRVMAGADLAFVRDSAALVHVVEDLGIFAVDSERVWVPTGVPMRPSIVFRDIVRDVEQSGASGLCADDHYYASMLEVAEECDTPHVRFPSDPEKISQAFVRLRVLFGMGRVDLRNASPQLVQELKDTMGKPLKSGVLSITHIRKPGSHGDIARAFVCAMYAHERADVTAWESRESMSTGLRRMLGARQIAAVSADGRMRDLPPRRRELPR